MRSHWSAMTSGGVKTLSPPNSAIWRGRARSQWSLSRLLTITPGPTIENTTMKQIDRLVSPNR